MLQDDGSWYGLFRAELYRALEAALAGSGWRYAFDRRTQLLTLLDHRGAGRVAITLPADHRARQPSEVAREMTERAVEMARDAGMP